MQQYYDQKKGEDFSERISTIQARLRTTPFHPDKSKFGISGSTFRAYKGFDFRPSLVYRFWAAEKTKKVLAPGHRIPYTQEEFDQWHTALFNSIMDHWKREQGRALSLAHGYKVVDLYLKWLTSIQACPENLCHSIVKYGYCALDSQILIELNKCLSGILPIRNPSMGDIQNKNTYDYCQSLITGFAENFGGTRVLFDYYAWKPGGSRKTSQ